MKIKQLFILVLFIVALFGCTTFRNVEVSVNSMDSPGAEDKLCYHLMPEDRKISENDLLFQEFSDYTKKILHENGYYEAQNNEAPQIVVFLSYEVSEPETREINSAVPIFGQTGSTKTTTSSTFSTGQSMSITTSKPTYGVTGVVNTSRQITLYSYHIKLVAIDWSYYMNTKKIKEVWRSDAIYVDESGDLRAAFPVMIAALGPYIGKDTGKSVQVSMNPNSDSVQNLQN